MLSTLSSQEKQAVRHFNDRIRRGDLVETPVFLDDFILSVFQHLSETAEIVDVGCGFGRSVPILEQIGFTRYLGVDPSRDSVELCRKKFPNYCFEEDEIRTLGRHYPERFDAFFLTAVLMHLPRRDLNIAINSLRRSLKKGASGLVALPFGQTAGEVGTSGGLRVTLFTPTETIVAFTSNNFEVVQAGTSGPMFLAHMVAT